MPTASISFLAGGVPLTLVYIYIYIYIHLSFYICWYQKLLEQIYTPRLLMEMFHGKSAPREGTSIERPLVFSKENATPLTRKLLQFTDYGDANRIGTACSKDDIAIFQGSTSPLPHGIPSYTVQILNVFVSGCNMSNIHVSCGWFSSARLINPSVFKRVNYDDCLVNDGDALGPGETLSFQYANTFPYPLSVTSVTCC
ncbi:hypothetical protein K2173_004633 [Erythroxylum novogranatense]|uniref:Uncharacterized protein n=1 Tax=Erythroxylum novogranatense TaxID=1862640 RepID=A0AAV8SYX1_9ROSI|nr:hypothetical protein K2173_004633 [Erythroxylum novogranatense]